MTMNNIMMTLMATGTMITMNSNSLFTAWVGLEINLMGFLPLLASEKSPQSKTTMLTYFIIQSLSSSMFIMSSLLTNSNYMMPLTEHIMMLTMATKLGMAPVFMWVPLCAKTMTFKNLSILLTWQKLGPMSVMAQTASTMKPMVLTLTLAISPLVAMMQTNMKMIMAGSSMLHVSWMTASTLINSTMWLKYLSVYSISTLIVILLLWHQNMTAVTQTPKIASPLFNIMFSVTLMSMAGMPPLLGFFPKWMVLSHLALVSVSMSTMLVLSSTMNMYIYSRMMLSMATMSHMHNSPTVAKTSISVLVTMTLMSLALSAIML